jgi:hypothetical protein
MSDFIIKPEEVQKYIVPIQVTGDWVSFRHPDFPMNSASHSAARFNKEGETAYYLASGVATAKAEVPKWEERELYKVAPATIHAFDLASWSKDHGRYEDFLRSKQDGGHGVCQHVADQLTHVHGLSGILYNSEPMYAAGSTGYCLAVLPPSGQLVDGQFFVKDVDAGVCSPPASGSPPNP